MESSLIPTIDLSPFLDGSQDEDAKNKAIKIIRKACTEYGFFQIVNHGMSVKLMTRALELSRGFFELSKEEKLKCVPSTGNDLPVGYNKVPDHLIAKKESFVMLPPESNLNMVPENPPEFWDVMKNLYTHFTKISLVVKSIINDCIGLPPHFLQEYNDNRSTDRMLAIHYFPATETDNIGIMAHEDLNLFTLLLQDGVGGLQLYKDGEWIPIIPCEGTLVINIGDVTQVLSNKKLKSATHRVLLPPGTSRYSFGYFCSLDQDKWIEPLPQFTKAIGNEPKYRGFHLKDYQQLRGKQSKNPPSRPEDVLHVSHYEITN